MDFPPTTVNEFELIEEIVTTTGEVVTAVGGVDVAAVGVRDPLQ